MLTLFDTHAHLDDEQFDAIRDDVVQRAREAGVDYMIAMGTTAESSQVCAQLATTYDSVWASVGIQPNYAHQATEADWQVITELAQQDRVLAIGETGLDRYWDYCPFDVQERWFDRHIELSRSSGKPFIVHMRECEADILATFSRLSAGEALNGIMHSFAGSWDTAKAALDFGLDISFAGMVTYKKSDDLREVAKKVPLDRLLIETDSPYLSPHPKRGHRPNEPSMVVHTAQCLADVHGVSLDTIARHTTENACRRFGLSNS